jgi:adenylosuccinate lyase
VISRVSESEVYRHLWTTECSDRTFGEQERLRSWLSILVALAKAEAEQGIVPAGVVGALRDVGVDQLDLQRIAAETRATGHSMVGLIRELQRVLPPEVSEWVYYGATVQDVTDTWFGLVMRDVAAVVQSDVRALERVLLHVATSHRTTPMTGRSHAQAGAPIPFGFKVASWADELRRHDERLEQGSARWAVGQLGGAVGALGFFGTTGTALRQRFCELLDLGDPQISWTTSRDRLVEFAQALVLVGATLARIGNEVLELQRPEIDEVREAPTAAGIGSITMPHKRNPETAEHLDTLCRLARSQLSVLEEGLTGIHERDGRGWKAEWVALPEVCILTMTALSLAGPMVSGLEVDIAAMRRNLTERGTTMGSERLLAGLAARMGKQSAQAGLQRLLHDDTGVTRSLSEPALVAEISAMSGAPASEIETWLGADAFVAATTMVDDVVRRGHRALAAGR